MEYNKLEELKKTNILLDAKIKSLLDNNQNMENQFSSYNYKPIITLDIDNSVTNYKIIQLKGNMKSNVLTDDVFNRIVCVAGKIKITFINTNEEIILTPPNTVLIIPHREYIFDIIEDCELISVYSPSKKDEILNIIDEESIYKKK